jgi:serine/threonine-protein kinase
MREQLADVALAPTATPDRTATDVHIDAGPSGPEAERLKPGQLLAGRYRIGRFIARGGIGEVYEADDALLGEPVAVKLLRAEMSRKPGAQERFATEIRLARKVTHPNVCRVFDVGVDGERVFFTMELHPGETLAARLRANGPCSIYQAAPIVRQLLAGVAAAHAADVVHTDLKPSNVLLTDTRAIVTDFGLAVPCCATLGCECSMPHLIGTPAYMAPEQVTGGSLIEQTDLFSVGVILFEMMTGVLPWTGATAHELAHARLTGETPSPSAHVADLPPSWDAVIRACLAVEPVARPRSAAEIARMLGV